MAWYWTALAAWVIGSFPAGILVGTWLNRQGQS